MRISDWSSDVCSSDLFVQQPHEQRANFTEHSAQVCVIVGPQQRLIVACFAQQIAVFGTGTEFAHQLAQHPIHGPGVCLWCLDQVIELRAVAVERSEERSVGKEVVSTVRSRWSP